MVFGATIFMFLALDYTSAGDASAIMNSIPIPVMILSYLIFHEPFRIYMFISTAILVTGIFIISKPGFIIGNDKFDSQNLVK